MALATLEQPSDIERFTSAVKEGDIRQTREFLKTHVTLVMYHDPNHKHYTPLHWAAKNGNTGMVEVVLEVMVEENIALDAKDEVGETALHIAAQNGHLDTVKLLILNGAKADAVDNDGYTALHWAAEQDRVDIAKELLMSQAININRADNDHNTPLHLACQEGKLEMVNLLIEKGANVSTVGEHGYVPLHWAAQKGYIKIASVLLKHNGSLSATDQCKNTPLHLAARKGHVKTAQYLVNKGANLEALEETNKTPLQLAEQEGRTKVAEMLKLIAFKRKRKEFDREYGNDDDGGIKTEIEEQLFKIGDVVSVGSGVNKEWRETGKYGGLCILVKVSVDPEEFKADHPEYKNEPYFIRQCGTNFVNECRPRGKHITTVSSPSKGTVGLITSNASNNSVYGITAFHVLHPSCEENNGIDEDTWNTYREDIEEYDSNKKDHWLSNTLYYVNDEEPAWSFVGGIYNSYLDIGVVKTPNNSVSLMDTYDFEWPSIFAEEEKKHFHKILFNYQINATKDFVVYHNGCVSSATSYGELEASQCKARLFSARNGDWVFLENHACVTAIPPGQLDLYSKQISIDGLKKYCSNYSENVDSDASESEGEEQSNHNTNDDDDDDVVFEEQMLGLVDDNHNSAETFTSPGDSGGTYYVEIKGTDKVYKVPIAIHRCQTSDTEEQNGSTSYGSSIDQLALSSIGEKCNIKF